jgi:hypothetical protein
MKAKKRSQSEWCRRCALMSACKCIKSGEGAGSIRNMPNGLTKAAYPSLGESALARQNETLQALLASA